MAVALAQADISKAVYTCILGDGDGKADASVRLGAEGTDIFVPNINSGKWNDEAWFNLNPKWFTVGRSATQDFKSNCAEVTVGDVKIKSWPLNQGVLEYAVCFSSMPAMTSIPLEILHSGGLNFSFQPELTAKEIENHCVRPDNVVGSYAAYLGKKNNRYKTGKFCHLYRWECIDADGKREWCGPLEIDPIDSQTAMLSIPLPVDWLKTAKFPVVCMGAGDTFGYTSAGASDAYYSDGDVGIICKATLSADGDISKISVYCHRHFGNPTNGKGLIYDDDGASGEPTTLTGVSSIHSFSGDSGGNVPAWIDFTFSPDVSLTAGDWYLGLVGDNYIWMHYDSTGTSRHYNCGYASPSNWAPASDIHYDRIHSIYATYTPSGGGLPIPVAMNHYMHH